MIPMRNAATATITTSRIALQYNDTVTKQRMSANRWRRAARPLYSSIKAMSSG